MTPQLNPPADEHLLWRMISHISLNFLSLADAANLKMMLDLYVFSERQDHGREIANRHRIAGIESLEAEPDRLESTFLRLFGRNPADLVLRFLDEDSSLGQEARLVLTLPPLPFLRAMARRTRRMCRAGLEPG